MICLWHQWKLSRVCDARRPIPETLRRHAAGCPHCGAYLHAAEWAAAARPAPAVVPSGLHPRIMTGVAAARLQPQPDRVRALRLAPAWASAVVLLVVAGLYFGGLRPSPRLPPPAPSAVSAIPSAAIVSSAMAGADALMKASLQEERRRIVEDLHTTSRALIAALDPLRDLLE